MAWRGASRLAARVGTSYARALLSPRLLPRLVADMWGMGIKTGAETQRQRAQRRRAGGEEPKGEKERGCGLGSEDTLHAGWLAGIGRQQSMPAQMRHHGIAPFERPASLAQSRAVTTTRHSSSHRSSQRREREIAMNATAR